ncbi:MAG: hypothetical protein CL675_04005 [Bdellovibrionaceae bacterium]|nr:hypothetical protein [Pseudobdellovibrionaceae bacterium]
MAKALIQASSHSDAKHLQSLLEKHLVDVHLTFEKTSTRSMLNYEPPSVLIFALHQFEATDLAFCEDLITAGFDRPILVLSQKVFTSAEVIKTRQIHMLETPFTDRDIVATVNKLLTNPNSPAQRHKRFTTSQDVRIEAMVSGVMTTSQMLNLSKGGAYIELDELAGWNEGELVRLNIPMKDLNKNHTMHGRVVWTTARHKKSGKPGLGLEFVPNDDVYRLLSENL